MARAGLTVKVIGQDQGQANAVGSISIEGTFTSCSNVFSSEVISSGLLLAIV